MQPFSGENLRRSREYVPLGLRVSAAWSWRLVITFAAVAVLIWVLKPVRDLVIAVMLAILLRVLIGPLVDFLRIKVRMNRTLAAFVGLLVGMAVVAGLLWLALDQLIRSIPTFMANIVEGIDQVTEWIDSLTERPAPGELGSFFAHFQGDLFEIIKSNSAAVASEALGIATSAVGLVAAGLVMMFTLFFMLRDGRGMWVWFLRMLPVDARNPVNEATLRGWVTLGNYVRTQIIVAGIDAIGIGIGAIVLQVPLAIPIMVLVFFGSFIPIVGAFVSGAVAVFIALVNGSLTTAIFMFLVVLVVQQVESNVLQPWLMSSAVSIHPVAVVLAVTAGSLIAGIPGAVFSVPLVSFLNVVTLYWHGHDTMPQLVNDPDRPGGPPGSLTEEIAASYEREIQPDRVATEMDEPPTAGE